MSLLSQLLTGALGTTCTRGPALAHRVSRARGTGSVGDSVGEGTHSHVRGGLCWQNVFFGPCASCPCMKSTSIDKEIQSLGKDLEVWA